MNDLSIMKKHLENKDYLAVSNEIGNLYIQKLDEDTITDLRRIIDTIPEKEELESVDFIYSAFLLMVTTGEIDRAEKYLSKLNSFRNKCGAGSEERKKLENRIFCAGIFLPKSESQNLIMNLAFLANEYSDAKFELAKISPTAKFPSVLHGSRDLSDFAKYYRAVVTMIKPLLPILIEDEAHGVCETAVAEILYEKDDINGASIELVKGLASNSPDVLFAAYSLMIRISLMDKDEKKTAENISQITNIIKDKNALWLIPNLKAFCARIDIIKDNSQNVKSWMDELALNDINDCTKSNFYKLMTKLRAYLYFKEYRNALTLAENLLNQFIEHKRTFDIIECQIYSAIICDQLGSGDMAVSRLNLALEKAEEYGYVNVFAECGSALLNLMDKYEAVEEYVENKERVFYKKVKNATLRFAQLYPNLYGISYTVSSKEVQEEIPELTQSELDVLTLLDKGKTNKEISSKLHISSSTVKFHISNIMKKMEVSNRSSAVNAARERGVIK